MPDVNLEFRDFSINNVNKFFEIFECEFFEFFYHLCSNDYSIDECLELINSFLISTCNQFFSEKEENHIS